MKRINNKGITTIEVLISFVIVSIITASLYTTISNYNQKRLIEGYKAKIFAYKNTLTKEIQDDFIKKGLTHASYKKDYVGSSTVYTVNCDLRDGTKRELIITQRFTDSTYHKGDPSVDDYFMIQYGERETDNLLEYPLPNVGESLSENGKTVYDLSINNVLINVEDENVLSIYIGFYHPELMTRYGINIISPIDFVSKGVDASSHFNVREVTKASKKYSFNANGGSGVVSPVAATIGQPFTIPGKGVITRNGYTLIKWNTQADGSGKDFELGSTIVPASNQVNDIILYAQWEKVSPAKFDYSNSIKKYTVPADGRYKLEAWGASGGATTNDQSKSSHAGLGGYTTAEVKLRKGDILHVVVGGKGAFATSGSANGGYNGGGNSGTNSSGGSGSGGGATHIAQVTGLLKNLSASKDKILIVAGGGGGANNESGTIAGSVNDGSGGCGGGTAGGNAYIDGVLVTGTDYHNATADIDSGCGLAGTQTKGYAFGQGENVLTSVSTGGAGGGWYGGYSTSNSNGGGAGGSGHINTAKIISGTERMYCYQCKVDTVTSSTNDFSSDPISKKAKVGNGYVKITFITD